MADEKRVKVTAPNGTVAEVKESKVDTYLAAGFSKAAGESKSTESKGDKPQPTREASKSEKDDSAVQAVTRKGDKS